MLKKPRFKNCYRAETVDGEGVFIIGERGSFLLSEDPLYQISIPLIDGNLTTEEIIDRTVSNLLLAEGTSTGEAEETNFNVQLAIEIGAKIQYALIEMKQAGYLVESEETQAELGTQLTAFCESLNIDQKQASRRLQTTKLAVKTFGNVAASELTATLESLGVQIADEADADLVLALTDSYLREGLDAFNQEALAKSRPWILVKPVGTVIWFGPVFQPGKTACWQCLAQRLRDNRPLEAFIEGRRDNSSPLIPPLTDLAISQETALRMTALETLKLILLGENKRLEGVIAIYDSLSLAIQNHPLVKRPQCPRCGYLKPQKRPLPVILGSRQKRFTKDGGHRYVTPEETLKRYQHHISPISGAVRALEKLPWDCNDLVFIYKAKHHCAAAFDDIDNLKKNIGGRSAGKGRTDAQARASGLCEAIERYSGVFQGDELRIKNSYRGLGDRAIHPNACTNFSRAQYDNRAFWNAGRGDLFQKVPELFDEGREIEWTPVWSLTEQDFKYLPTAYCYFGYPLPPNPDCWANTNGCAAGNTLEEAILHGFLELVERDSVALWWYNRLQKPGVDLDSFEEPYFRAITEYYQSIGREIWVLDLTGDLEIPTFAAISRRGDRSVEDIIFGFGTHFDPKLAIQRALTEVSQVLPAVLNANPDGSTRYAISAEPQMLHWWQTATRENQPYLVPNPEVSSKCYSDYKVVWHEDFLEDVKYCQNLVGEKGMEMLVLDQTRPDIGLNVVKVIVPGLRHFWKRLGPGRLYDVPVDMGWLDKPLMEEDMNPIPLWM